MWRDALLVGGKDLRIEARSRVALAQIAPFGVIVLVLFAFALGPDQSPLVHAAPGLFWVAILFSTVLAVQRSVAVEAGDASRDGLRLAGLDPAGIFLGKAAAVGAQLLVLQAVLAAGVILLFGARVVHPWLLLGTCAAGAVGLAASGTLYGALSAGVRMRETLLPFLLLPVVAPVLLAGTRLWQASLAGGAPDVGSSWMRLLLVFDAVYLALGVVVFGPLTEAA